MIQIFAFYTLVITLPVFFGLGLAFMMRKDDAGFIVLLISGVLLAEAISIYQKI
jgi:hypothetical protein